MNKSEYYQKKDIIEIISENSFYILSLDSLAEMLEINKKADYIKKKLKLNLKYLPDFSNFLFRNSEINESNLNNILMGLKNEEQKVFEKLLWFFSPDEIFSELNKDIVWSRAAFLMGDHKYIKYVHDGALLGLLYLFKYDKELEEFNKWKMVLAKWKYLIFNSKLLEFYLSGKETSKLLLKKDFFDLIIQSTIIPIIQDALNKNNLIIFSRVIELLKELKLESSYINITFMIFEERFQNILDNLEEYNKNIHYGEENKYKNFTHNKEYCDAAYNKYILIIEKMLAVAMLHLDRDDNLLLNIKEDAAKFLNLLSINYTWGDDFKKAYDTAAKGVNISKGLPVEVDLKRLQSKFLKYRKFKHDNSFEEKSNKYLYRNPFRLLDLNTTASEKDIKRALKLLNIKEENNFNKDLVWDLRFLDLGDYDKNDVKNLMENDYRKMRSKLFWFINREDVIKDLNKDQILEVTNYWYRTDSFTHKHDAALLAFIYLFKYDRGFEEIEEWSNALFYWNESSEHIAKFIFNKGRDIRYMVKWIANKMIIEMIIETIKIANTQQINIIKNNIETIIKDRKTLSENEENNVFQLLNNQKYLLFNDFTI